MIITRFHNMERLDVTVEFLTPTFLGGADQQAELRSPPFKNLLRQWWRVANGHLDVQSLRQQEGELFGTVLGESETSASNVRLVITPGDRFTVSSQPFQLGTTRHPEVGQNGMNVQNALYLGFGPVTYKQGTMHFRKYIAPDSVADIKILLPRQKREVIVAALQLMDAFGTIGSRCRNGYGSVALTMDGLTRPDLTTILSRQLSELVDNHQKEYPNHLGHDNNGKLLWESGIQPQWMNAMTLLAGTYLQTRTNIQINGAGLQPRHALGYPVTNHTVANWGGNNGRMSSQLRLMVKRNHENQLVARILHLPHRLPDDKPWPGNLPTQLQVWRQVHQFLDGQNQFHRIGGAA